MALIKCPECGKEISDKAASCPSCGCPISQASNDYQTDYRNVSYANNEYDDDEPEPKNYWVKYILKTFLGVIGGLIVLSIVINIFSNTKKKTEVATQEQTIYNSHEQFYDETYDEQVEPEIVYTPITSTELITLYKDNQVKCKQVYDGVMLEVTGSVTSVGTDVLDQTFVCLGNDEDEYTFIGIQCIASDENTEKMIAELHEGDVITVRGKGDCGSLSFSLENSEIITVN